MSAKLKQIKIAHVKQVGHYALQIEFSDRKTQVVDFEPFLQKSVHPEVRKFLNPQKFKNFKVIDGDLMWGDYDMIFPIHDLYNNSIN